MPYLTLYAAGSNSHGQLGIGHEDDAHSFTKCHDLTLEVNDINTLQVKLCAGANHTLLLVRHDGLNELFLVGSSRSGQLGKIVQAEDENKLSFQRLSIDKLLDDLDILSYGLRREPWIFKDVAAAWETSFFLLENTEDPSKTILLASGSNDFGQVATTHSKNHSNIITFPEGKRIASVHSGPRHTLAVAEDGHVYGWGASRHGQLGSEAIEAITYTPERVNESNVAVSSPTAIALGHQHTAIASSDAHGLVLLLGNNKKGQLGTLDPKAKVSSLKSLSGLTLELAHSDAIEVFANWNSTFILDRRSNELQSFGNNASGQLGRESHSFGDIGSVVFDGDGRVGERQAGRIVQVACGSEHTLAILENESTGEKEAWGWGWNEHGNLGLGEDILHDVKKPVRLHLPSDSSGKLHSVHAGNGTSWIATIEHSM